MIFELGIQKGGRISKDLSFEISIGRWGLGLSPHRRVGHWKQYLLRPPMTGRHPVNINIKSPTIGKAWLCWRAWFEK